MISIILQKASGKTVDLPFFGAGLGFSLVISGSAARNEYLTLELYKCTNLNRVLHYIISKRVFESTGKLDTFLFRDWFFLFLWNLN